MDLAESAKYLQHHLALPGRTDPLIADGVCFDPEAAYCGVLFGTAIVTLTLTAGARVHEILQISADRFVKPVPIYVVKNPDDTPKRDPATNKSVTDVIIEQRAGLT